MATTIPTRYELRRSNLSMTLRPRVLINTLQEMYESALADSDKAGDMEDACYLNGYVDALVDALHLLTEESR